jgi:sugar lactone lactonase YvrE
MSRVEVAVPRADVLGECPLWNVEEQALYWIDSRAPALYRWREGGAVDTWPLPELVGSVAFRKVGGVILAMQAGIHAFDLGSRAMRTLATPEPDRPDNRFNDGRCDRRGRFWVGTMSAVSREPHGSLYRLDPYGPCTRVFNGIIVPNSLAWSPDDRTMYFADTYQSCIWAFDYDIDAGSIANRRVFNDLRGQPGRPDGSAVDAEGCVWNCEYAGSRVVRYTPSGTIDRVIPVPVDNPTCCAFGSRDLRTLFITSARQRLTPEQLATQPLAGSVLAVRTDVGGLPEHCFGTAM